MSGDNYKHVTKNNNVFHDGEASGSTNKSVKRPLISGESSNFIEKKRQNAERNTEKPQEEQVKMPDIPQFKRNLRQLPNAEDNVVDFLEEVLRSSTIQDIADGEAMFKDILLHPFLKAVCVASVAGVPQFKVDETLLRAISKRANESEIDNDESTLYIADGIISLYDFNKVEVLLLETSGRFGSLNNSKSSFDHHKGLFGSLSMLKVTAGNYPFRSLETFKKM
ncbi:hypothetical protein PS15m_006768 [Mucor circinelloides]